MKRLLIGTFLLLYTTFTVVTAAEHTFTWASATATGVKSHAGVAKRLPSHSSQTRFLEQPFVVPRLILESPLLQAAMNASAPAAEQLADNLDQPVQPRAPPAL
jgi:hypothetical protein